MNTIKISKMNQVYHKIRGSHPGYIGIELPNEYEVILLDEENFNAYRSNRKYNAVNLDVRDSYCHFEKPVNGSWHLLIEGDSRIFSPKDIHIIYKAA
tara:strand:- start:291 stop:581 length:291 start_codon:yes stop_codon:yes gene_type:complete